MLIKNLLTLFNRDFLGVIYLILSLLLKNFLNVTHMDEENFDFGNPRQIIQILVKDHETIIHIIRNDITPVSEKYSEPGTTDFVSGLMKKHEKMARMLKTFLI